ncbi:MAG: VOC family protein [Betaproteobacteria bacterium]|nr:MAG: VOC family protein [Betaproteobacteria bacterium]
MAKKAKARPKKKVQAKVAPIPAGYHSVTPYLCIRGAVQALEFYKKAFGAKELMRMAGPDGKLGHAEIKIGDSHVMMADEFPGMGFLGPQSRGGTTVMLHVYVKNVDATVAQATAAGAMLKRPIKDEFYGDRSGAVEDPFGHLWHIATHKEDLSPAELRRRSDEAMKKMASGG